MNAPAISILLALWVEGALALGLVALLGRQRIPRIRRGEIAARDVALSREAWPDQVKQVSNAVDNQFQLPVLFYLAGAGALYLGPGLLEAALAWLFVGSRLVHAFIHVTSNQIFHRFYAFAAGFAALSILWVVLLFRILLAGAA